MTFFCSHRLPIASFLIALTLHYQLVASDHNVVPFLFMLSSQNTNESSSAGLIEQTTTGVQPEVQPAVDMALETINDSPYVLSNYELSYDDNAVNSMCSQRTALTQFFNIIRSSPPRVFVLGAGCSVATEIIGELSNFWEVITMSYSSQSPKLSDRSLYPNVFRTVPSSVGIVGLLRGLFTQYGWTQLLVITQLENEFESVAALLDSSPINTNITYFQTQQNIANVISFTENNYRIYFLNMYPYHARRVLCAAYQTNNDIYYPRYVWLTLGWYPSQWWRENVTGVDPLVTCTDAQLETFLDRSLVLSHYPLSDDMNEPNDVEMTTTQFYSQYRSLLPTNVSESYAAPFAYDALWALAFAINRSLPSLSYNLTQFDHESIGREITAAVSRELYNLTFAGTTGQVSFDSNGTRVETQPRVLQYRSGSSSPVLVGRITINSSSDEYDWMYVMNESNDSTWPIIIPYDGTPVTEVVGLLTIVFALVYVLGFASLILGIVCAIITFIFRKRKIIRLTSPNLNYLIILGCMTLTVSALLYSFSSTCSTTIQVLCYIRAYTQLVGYSLCFGTICAKMIRVYIIFDNPSTKKRKPPQDWHLLLAVLALCAVDIVYITIALALDRDYKPVVVEDKERRSGVNEYGIEVQYQNIVCDSPRSIIWIGIVFFMKFLVQVVAVFFALKTRKVKIKAINDAKWIAIIIYVTSACLTVLLVTSFLLSSFLNADAGAFSAGLIILSFIVLLILFIPKWYSLYKDPKGENVFEKGTQQSFSHLTSNPDQDAMIKRIDELEKRLGKHESVTPFQSRKRVFSSGSVLDARTNPRLTAALAVQTKDRSQSYSPAPFPNVTESLPVGRLAITPTSPRSPNNIPDISGSYDTGLNSFSQENPSNGVMYTLREADEKTESQRVLLEESIVEMKETTSPV